VADDRVDHHLCRGRLLALVEQTLLSVPGLRGRVEHRGLTDQAPSGLTPVLGEGLFFVTGVRVIVEELALDLATDIEDRHREHGDEDVGVLHGLQHFLGERNLGQGGGLGSRGVDPEVLDRFLDTEEVPAHDLAGTLLRDRRFETAVLDQTHHLGGEIVTLRVDDLLGEFVVETRGLELEEHFVLLVH